MAAWHLLLDCNCPGIEKNDCGLARKDRQGQTDKFDAMEVNRVIQEQLVTQNSKQY